nr:hypothetical protein [Tanacetum cinerariifolium]
MILMFLTDLKGLFWRFIEDVITKTIAYYLFDVVVEFHRVIFRIMLHGGYFECWKAGLVVVVYDVNKSSVEYTKDNSNDEDNEDSHSAEEEQNTEDFERGRPRKSNDESKKQRIGSKREEREYKVEDDGDNDGTKKLKKKSKISDENNKNSKIRTRTTPTTLFNAMAILNGDRKKCLHEMGFGSIIGMGIHELPGKL